MTTCKKQKLGLALSSGGVLAYAHIGVLQALEELHVQVDLFSGASMGAATTAPIEAPENRSTWT